ncbi:MAG: restriction endonuclease subunit R [Myxacorys californica WJT36-NPBG1]|nr:restriction endonuclease subunit R [Myxacorys californica WJT36-NPBG1]
MTILNAKDLTLLEVHQLLRIEERFENLSFTSLLTLEPLSEFEQREVAQICQDFREYLKLGKVSEGQVKLLALAPLLRLAGFYQQPIKLSLEQDIAEIIVEDEDVQIRGRLDILAADRSKNAAPFFWMLVIESKNSTVEALAGLPQLLTYAHTSLQRQDTVWGLTTNGISYRFVYLRAGSPSLYQLLPEVNLVDPERAVQLFQVLKAVARST